MFKLTENGKLPSKRAVGTHVMFMILNTDSAEYTLAFKKHGRN